MPRRATGIPMFLRLLFLLLLALNIGVAAWLVFGHPPTTSVAATDPGVPELKLLSEVSSAAGGHAGTSGGSAAGGRAAAPGDRCMALGPFDTQADARKELQHVRAHVKRARFQEQTAEETTGWWVYLPALASRESALAAARKLSAAGIHDYYVITAGDNSNTISLGLFHDPDNARRRRDHVAALGFKPQLTQRTESMPQYWVELALARRSRFDWHAYVSDPDVHARHIQCF